MFRTAKITSVFCMLSLISLMAFGQHITKYNLAKLLEQNKLDTNDSTQTHALTNDKKGAINTKNIVWLNGVTFKEGTIDIDLRGRDVFLQSFLGIAWHAKDTASYELIYFRPFRFHSTDTPTRKWSVQYTSLPDYDYVKLRKEHPFVYENEANPAPASADWFHATIVVKGDSIKVYINHSKTASLEIKKLHDYTDGMIGLWSSKGSLSSDFANLTITE